MKAGDRVTVQSLVGLSYQPATVIRPEHWEGDETWVDVQLDRTGAKVAVEPWRVTLGVTDRDRLWLEHRDTDVHTGDNYVEGCPTCEGDETYPEPVG